MAKMVLILLLVILIGLPALGLSRSFAETSNDYVLSNDRLILELDARTGLCRVTDKQTGRIWSQCYAIPPENEKAYTFDFTDSGTWSLNGAEVADGDLWIPANANSQIQVRMNFPAQTLLPASYVLRFAYRLEQASDIKADGCFYFEQDGYTPKGNKAFSIVTSYAGAVQTQTEWQYVEIPINLENFPAYANCFLVYFTVTGGEKASAAVVIHDAALYGGSAASAIPKVTNVRKTGTALYFTVNNLERELAQLPPINVSVSLTPSRSDEVSFTLSSEEDELYYQNFSFPGSFVTLDESLHWVLPKDAGLYLPAYDLNNSTNNAYHGVKCTPIWA